MTHTYEYEYGSNLHENRFGEFVFKKILSRGTVTMPDLTYYGYDGYSNYHKARKIFQRELMKKVKAELGLTGVRGSVYDGGDTIEFQPYRSNKTLFITYKDQ